jgi:addiction module RelE/StbE family toxin
VVKVKYSPAAEQDLTEIGDYIADTLNSPIAALNTVDKIQDAVDNLVEFPLMGSPLYSRDGTATDYRYLVSGNYLVFYRAKADIAYIDRIIYGRRDYMTILFGKAPKDELEAAE